MTTPTQQIPEDVAGRIGFVLCFTPKGEERIKEVARTRTSKDFEPLLEKHPPHSTLAHTSVTSADGSKLARCVAQLRAMCVERVLTLDRLTHIGGRFRALQASAPDPQLQLAAIVAAVCLRRWLDTTVVQGALKERLRMTEHQAWCLETFGHPLALPDPDNGDSNRALHVSLGYKSKGKAMAGVPSEAHSLSVVIADVRLVQIGDWGVVQAYYDV